ncbi:alpha/beta fold hydrolase [Teredinibacter purpureus]|uniref:alpha/beta fold hydrolase n=1 Tax=Teredinibacter purpureus TaxID=2731756 RepID=UPI0005F82039|nr:alpha/beta hydrolase [Teredinibacter purpureus]
MSYLAELRDLVMLHAHAQNMDIPRCSNILERVRELQSEKEGSWAYEWMSEARGLLGQGNNYDAYQYFNLARFPYPSTPLMHEAHSTCVATFKEWINNAAPDVECCHAPYRGCIIPFYLYPCDKKNAPTLLVMGGIVSLKEQWGQFLLAGKKLGMSVIVAEMPGVGENPLPYDEHSYGYLTALLDAVSAKVNVDYVHTVMMSFSGNLAIGQAPFDQRIRAITSVGAPIQAFFLDLEWWQSVPNTTKYTLAHLCRQEVDSVFSYLSRFAISEEEIANLDIPLYYVRSSRDEIIPSEEGNILKRNARNFYLKEFDDVHGSPDNMAEMQKFVPWTVLNESRQKPFIKHILGVLLLVNNFKRKLGLKK